MTATASARHPATVRASHPRAFEHGLHATPGMPTSDSDTLVGCNSIPCWWLHRWTYGWIPVWHWLSPDCFEFWLSFHLELVICALNLGLDPQLYILRWAWTSLFKSASYPWFYSIECIDNTSSGTSSPKSPKKTTEDAHPAGVFPELRTHCCSKTYPAVAAGLAGRRLELDAWQVQWL